MSNSIYVNMPVKDVAAAREFYGKVFKINEDFSSELNAAVIVNDNILLMMVGEDFFKQNAKRDIADTDKVAEATMAIQLGSREAVDKTVDAAIGAGGKKMGEPTEADGMYTRSFCDLDGHHFDIFCMLG